MVACLWEQRVDRETDHRVVPDGCADVIVSEGGEPVAAGLADRAVVHHLGSGSRLLGLRLRPEAVATFFGVPADHLRNEDLALDDVVGSRRARRLVDSVVHGAPEPLLLALPARVVALSIDLLGSHTVEEAAETLGLSSRHFRRLLIHHSGLGPKEHQRVIRLRRFLDNPGPLALAAVTSGYADQSHLAREVKRLCGLSPTALRSERQNVASRTSAQRSRAVRQLDSGVPEAATRSVLRPGRGAR
jgi:AraC-like DNA-binding protein